MCDVAGRVLDDYIVVAANQEHGILTWREGRASAALALPVGTRGSGTSIHSTSSCEPRTVRPGLVASAATGTVRWPARERIRATAPWTMSAGMVSAAGEALLRLISRQLRDEAGLLRAIDERLVERGVRFVQVNRGGFDVHTNAFPAMRDHGDVMDPALASLIEDLAQSGLLKKTMIVMLSEFGRTPKINATAGRDHWPKVFSVVLAGGGIKKGFA